MKRIILFILIGLFLISSNAFPQFGLKLGPLTALNFNIGTGSDLDQTQTGFGFVFGSQLDMKITPIIGIIAQVQFYDNMSGGTSVDQTTTGINQQGQQVSLSYTLNADNSIAYFMIEPLLKLNLPASGFYFLFGPSIGFNIESSTALSITSDQNLTFNDGLTKHTGTLKNMNVRFALKAGAGYDIPISNLLTLTPQFTFGYGITTVQSDVSSRVMNFQLAAIAKFRLI